MREQQPGFYEEDGYRVEPISVEIGACYAVQPPLVREPEPPALLLALHGWGQNCRSFMRWFNALRDRNVLVVAPQAPHQFYLDMKTKKVGFNWLTVYEREQSIREVNAYLVRVLEALQSQQAYDSERVVLLGFSQGSSVAYRFAVSGALRPAGLISCGGDLPLDVAESLPGVKHFPILLVHGREDTLLPVEKRVEALNGLTSAGFSYDRYEFEGGHSIPAEAIEVIGDWVEARGRKQLSEPC